MAITASGLYVQTVLSVFNASQEPLNLVGDTIKVALYTNSVTPDFYSDTSYSSSPYTSDQLSGTGYTTGGATLSSKTFSQSPNGTAMFDADDVAWTSSTFSGVRGALVWDDTPTTPVADPVICLVNFGADFGVSSGTFTIQWATGGIFNLTLAS